MSVKVRGRFWLERMGDGWQVIDSKYGLCLGHATKREATEMAQAARAYVRKWGDINFDSFPYSMDEAPAPFKEDGEAIHPEWSGPR